MNILSATELFSVKWLILCYVNSTLIKKQQQIFSYLQDGKELIQEAPWSLEIVNAA